MKKTIKSPRAKPYNMYLTSNRTLIGEQNNTVDSIESLEKYHSQLKFMRDSFADGSVFYDLRLSVLIAAQCYSELKHLPKNKIISELLNNYTQLLDQLSNYASENVLQIINKALHPISPLN